MLSSPIFYLGIDCVSSVIENNKLKHEKPGRRFEVGDIKTMPLPDADLLIIKDVFIHWKNKEIISFLNRVHTVKYILTTNDNHSDILNNDIDTPGLFHSIDVSKEPFNKEAENVLVWTEQQKTTALISID